MTHPGTNRARRWLTLFVENNTLNIMPFRQPYRIIAVRTDLVHICSSLPGRSLVLQGRVASDQVLHLEYVSCTKAWQNSASPRAAKHLNCSRRSQGPPVHTTPAASDHTGPLSWQQRCCLRSLAQSHLLRSSHGSLKKQTHVRHCNMFALLQVSGDWLGRSHPKWPVMCRVERQTLLVLVL